MSEGDDRPRRALRFGALLSFVLGTVPELGDWWRDWDDDEGRALTLGDLCSLVVRELFDGEGPVVTKDVWPRVFQVVEVALVVDDLLWSDVTREEDAIEVDAFAGSGIVCDVTRSRAGLHALLPWMGPVTVDSARIEVDAHSASRGFGVDDVDWSAAGSSFVGIDVEPTQLLPVRRSGQ